METKQYLKIQLGCMIIPFFGIAVGLVCPSFYWLAIGILLSVIILLNTLYSVITKENYNDCEFTGGIGLIAFFLITAIFTIAYWSHHETRYVIQNDKKLHLYEDCSSFPKGCEPKRVVEMEGFFHLCFNDCKICLKRSKAERKQKQIEWQKQKEAIARVERSGMIDVLLDAVEKLRHGESASAVGEELDRYLYDEGYCAGYYDENEYGELVRGIPSRYQ